MIHILLPAYNEEEGLEKLLDRIRRIGEAFRLEYRVLIVDDGSRDHTAVVIDSFAGQMPLERISFPENRGVTEVFLVGFHRICDGAPDDDICITLDADNTQSPYVILDVIDRMRHGADLVVASRFAPGGGMVKAPPVRRLLSLGVAFLLGKLVALPAIRDYSTFYRGYRVGLIRRGLATYGDRLMDGEGFSGMADMLIKLARIAREPAEVPLVLRYDLKEGGSGMRVFRTIKGYLAVLWRHHRFSRREAGVGHA